jgi:hypothetical protein
MPDSHDAPALVGDELALPGKGRPGRPRKLTPEKRAMLITFLCNSLSRTQACRLVGCRLQTLSNEMKRDPGFKLEVHRAELAGIAKAAACVTEHAASDPKIALLYLERKDPKRWGRRKVVVELTGGGAGDGKAAVAKLLAQLGAAPTPADAPPSPEPAEVPAGDQAGAGAG